MLVVGVLAAGCSVGNNADAFGGGYALVSPGGKTELSYAGPARRPIGELSGPDLINDGATVAVSAYPGKVVVVNFWGSWCAPCRAEADGLNTAARSLARQGVQFIGVDIKDTRAGGADFHTGKKVPYPSIFDSTMRTLLSLRGYPASAIPSTIVLDRSHRVSHVWLLPVTADQLLRVVAPIAAERVDVAIEMALPAVPAISSAAGITDTVLSGPFVVAAGLAFAAGAVSFASPCCIPLVPGYLAYLVGLVGAEGADAPGRVGVRVRTRAVGAAGLFVAGFTIVFLAQTVAVLGVARILLINNTFLMRIGGVVTMVMGLVMFGLIRPLQRDRRIHARPTGRIVGALLLGGAFGLGWVVCIGPTLAGMIALATATDWGGSAWRGLFLIVFYCAGLGLPFLLIALGFSWAGIAVAFLRRHSRTIQLAGGTMMIALGALMVTGWWGQFVAWLQVAVSGSNRVLL